MFKFIFLCSCFDLILFILLKHACKLDNIMINFPYCKVYQQKQKIAQFQEFLQSLFHFHLHFLILLNTLYHLIRLLLFLYPTKFYFLLYL